MSMAKTLQVRDLPDEVHAELRRRALVAGQSLSEYVADLLGAVASRPTIAEWVKQARNLPPTGLTTDQIVNSIRADRDGHDS